MKIPVFRPSIKRRDMDNVLSCMVSDRVGPGDLSKELAKIISKHLELFGGFTFSSYYTAISICLDVLKIEQNDNVILSVLAPAIYFDVLSEKGINPVLIDVEPDSGIFLIDKIKENLNKNPKAIIIHNTLGFVPDMEKLIQLEIPLIEDISHSLGCKFSEKYCGSFGELCIISLDIENTITAGQGGLLLSKDRKYIKEIKSLSAIDNLFLSDFNASLAIAQFKQFNSYIETRLDLGELFSGQLMQSRHKTLMQSTSNADYIPFSFPVLLETGMNDVKQYALKKNINTYNAFENSIIKRIEKENMDTDYPNAKSLLLRCLLFPLYPMLGKKNAETICRILVSLP